MSHLKQVDPEIYEVIRKETEHQLVVWEFLNTGTIQLNDFIRETWEAVKALN